MCISHNKNDYFFISPAFGLGLKSFKLVNGEVGMHYVKIVLAIPLTDTRLITCNPLPEYVGILVLL